MGLSRSFLCFVYFPFSLFFCLHFLCDLLISPFRVTSGGHLNALPIHQLRTLLWNVRYEHMRMDIRSSQAVEMLLQILLIEKRPLFRSLGGISLHTDLNGQDLMSLWRRFTELPLLTDLSVFANFESRGKATELAKSLTGPTLRVTLVHRSKPMRDEPD